MTGRFSLNPALLAAAALLLSGASAVAAETRLSGTLGFDAIGKPSLLKIRGTGKQVQGVLKHEGKSLSGEFVAKLDDLDTGLKLRNEHMKTKYLEVSRFPESRLKLLPIPLASEEGEFRSVPFKGILTVHGVEKEIQGVADIVISKTVQRVDASFVAKINDFGMQIPSFAGVTVADDVQVQVQMRP